MCMDPNPVDMDLHPVGMDLYPVGMDFMDLYLVMEVSIKTSMI